VKKLPALDRDRGISVDGLEGAVEGRTFAVVDPATGERVADVPNAGPADAMRALDRAVEAQARWASSAPLDRAAILARAADALVESGEAIARAITLESGKPSGEAHGEVRYAAGHLRWAAGAAERLCGTTLRAPGGDALYMTLREPVGPCLLITPWNFPAAMITRKVAPAIAAGCTMVLKPAEQTPLTALAIEQVLADSGLPDGVLNVVTTADPAAVCAPLMTDDRLRKLSFTGSTAVGRSLLAQAADLVMRVSMELGGNAPFVVFDDADLDVALSGALTAKFRNAGQACTAANRFYVQERIVEEFARRLTDATRGLRAGPGGDVGPLIDERQRRRVAALVVDAVDRGATVLTGGGALDGRGFFFAPTVLTAVAEDARVLHEEVFGPVAPICTFTDEEDLAPALRVGRHGLAAYVYTRDLARAMRVTSTVQAGLVGVNRALVSDPALPFGGVKASGLGREGGLAVVDEYLETKAVAVAMGHD
jgi:succinate-semialdehyde dehydrogenase / glutarate-semialdehyde dehydrogenase